MRIADQPIDFAPLPAALGAWQATVSADELVALCRAVHERGGRLVALWGSDERDRGRDFALHVALAAAEGLVWATLEVPAERPQYPDLTPIFAGAARMQRAVSDLLGVRAAGGDARPWLRHNNWPADYFPL